MIIFWDITKTNRNKVYSGLNRVSFKLRESLARKGCDLRLVEWISRKRAFFLPDTRKQVCLTKNDAFITPELFCENERPGITNWLQQCEGRCVAIFHDAIPLKFPEFTWPKSVARHPSYMKELSGFDLVLANSRYSRKELMDYWSWLELQNTPEVFAIPLGADFFGDARITDNVPLDRPLHLLMTGILEPRKNHEAVLGAVEILHAEGHPLQLSLVGRLNPHFGGPILSRVKQLIKKGLSIQYHRQLPDAGLIELYRQIDLSIFPSKAEGNGLPVIESIWQGKPSLVSAIPPHLEHAGGGKGITLVDPMNASTLASTLKEFVANRKLLKQTTKAAHLHQVPTWDQSAEAVIQAIKSS